VDAREIIERFVILIAAIIFGIWHDFSTTAWVMLVSFLFLLEAIGFFADKYEWRWAKQPEDATWLENWAGIIFVFGFFGTEYAVQYFYPDITWTVSYQLLVFVVLLVIIGIIENILNPVPKNEAKSELLSPRWVLWLEQKLLYLPHREKLLRQRKFIRNVFAFILPLTILLTILASDTNSFEQISEWAGFVCFLWAAVFFGTFIWTIPPDFESE
jgi:hypothetical protein